MGLRGEPRTVVVAVDIALPSSKFALRIRVDATRDGGGLNRSRCGSSPGEEVPLAADASLSEG